MLEIFEIGDKVKLSDYGRENENYINFIDSVLVIEDIDSEFDSEDLLYSFEDVEGVEVPFSLYAYEIYKL